MRDVNDLTGKLLIAMPDIGDPRFEHAVVLVCEHGSEGTMGVIINKPAEEVSLAEVAKQLELSPPVPEASPLVYFGGPVEMGRGFVLHSAEYVSGLSSHLVFEGVRLAGSLDVLEDIAQGRGPQQAILALGYAGWGEGQLEGEILSNGWLTVEADAELVFSEGSEAKWSRALGKLGINPLMLSADAGHA
ncbi:YqgE/AlgH family protein [Lentibacter algarum]|uniref:YqgE/AlgH family protein n=1 Tax=Lentibacter algarum TaxID=576131 RepID=UPI001C07AAD8|nr:YqgE/AlgH family protein [Lentibacter algarum]MBU2981881.1 YqgE/AlgH family protein [Lentibacter algarum]